MDKINIPLILTVLVPDAPIISASSSRNNLKNGWMPNIYCSIVSETILLHLGIK